MAHRKAGGSTQNLRDSQPKYLGVKLFDGQKAKTGCVLVRQRGTRVLAGANVKVGKDHTLFAAKDGIIKFADKRKMRFDGKTKKYKIVSVVSS